MKRIIILIVVCMLFNMMSGIVGYAENTKINKNGQIIINDVTIEQQYTENDIGELVPLRAVFEALGADVCWYGDVKEALSKDGICLELNTREPIAFAVTVTYLGEVYTCSFFAIDEGDSVVRIVFVQNPNMWDSVVGHKLALSATNETGWYEIIDDSVYLYSQAMKYFLKELGFNLEIDEEQNTIIITSETIN